MLGPLDTWSGISIGAISMGQEIGVTPIQLVTAVSAIANGGNLHKPYLISEIRKGEHLLYSGDVAQLEARQVLRPETAATVRKLMEGVILSPHGTGKSARLDGWTAAGKTGTAQKIDPNTKRYSPSQYIASFTGFAPINNRGDDSRVARFASWPPRRGTGSRAGVQADCGAGAAVSRCPPRRAGVGEAGAGFLQGR
jgi:cell division protein FtsI (penicillin-binding protein 3)